MLDMLLITLLLVVPWAVFGFLGHLSRLTCNRFRMSLAENDWTMGCMVINTIELIGTTPERQVLHRLAALLIKDIRENCLKRRTIRGLLSLGIAHLIAGAIWIKFWLFPNADDLRYLVGIGLLVLRHSKRPVP